MMTIFLVSCERDPINTNHNPDEATSFDKLEISPDFDFRSTQAVGFNVSIIPASDDELRHIIKIYSGHPAKGGRLLTKGMTSSDYIFDVNLNIPTRLQSVYIENRNAQGIYQLLEVAVTGNTVNQTFDSNSFLQKGYPQNKTVIVDPGCDECEESISGTYGQLQLDGKDYCVEEGSNLTIGNQLIFRNGATLVICGTANISQFSVRGNDISKLYISESGVLATAGDLNINAKLDLFNFGTHNISGNVNPNDPYKLYNYGTMNIAGTVNNNTSEFLNEGTVNVSGHFNCNRSIGFKNYGTLIITGHLQINGGSHAYNYCTLQVGGNLILNNKLDNYGYVGVTNSLTVNGGGDLKMSGHSLVDTKDLMLNGKIKGDGNAYGKVDISGNTTINGGGHVEGKVDLCDANGIETNNGNIGNEVVFCEVTIPQTACNPGSGGPGGGGGTPDPDDTDEDGVPDVDDDYPGDAERAFNSYYPNQQDFGTFVYEDLWPSKGDYDFNDLVLDFQYQIVTNADNKIVDIITKAHVKAAGASLNNGFGISFPTAPENCGNVNGFIHGGGYLDMNAEGYENGHSENTVVILYDAINTIYNGSFFNTVPGQNYIDTDTITVTTYFDNPQMEMGQEPYNPFLIIGQQRGMEVHLTDNEPTALADVSFFGSEDDSSNENAGRWYVTENNLPWAVEIPVSFDYPIENADIVNTHLKFEEWAESSGTVYNDWYLDEPGYRNQDNIYIKE